MLKCCTAQGEHLLPPLRGGQPAEFGGVSLRKAGGGSVPGVGVGSAPPADRRRKE